MYSDAMRLEDVLSVFDTVRLRDRDDAQRLARAFGFDADEDR